MAAGLFCFAAAWPLPVSLAIVLGSMLGALTLRDAYTHPHNSSCLDSAAGAAAAGASLFVTEALMLTISPKLAVPDTVLFRGAFSCLPLLFALRMVLLRPNPKNPFEGSNLSAEAIYKRVRIEGLCSSDHIQHLAPASKELVPAPWSSNGL